MRLHRLVAKVFLPHSHHKTQVNHIDGDTTNNRKDNLEWVTPSENCQHAVGLHSVGISVYAIDKHNGESRKRFPNVSEAARQLGIHAHIIRNRLDSGKLYDDRWSFEYVNKKDRVRQFVEDPIGNRIAVYNSITGEIQKFENAVECANTLKIDRRYIDEATTSANKPYKKNGKEYTFTRVQPWDSKVQSRVSGEGTSVKVHNITDNECNLYKSIKDAAQAEGISRGTIDKRLKTRTSYKQWTFTLEREVKGTAVKVIDSEGSLTNTYTKLVDVLTALNACDISITSQILKTHLRSGGVYLNRFTFEHLRPDSNGTVEL